MGNACVEQENAGLEISNPNSKLSHLKQGGNNESGHPVNSNVFNSHHGQVAGASSSIQRLSKASIVNPNSTFNNQDDSLSIPILQVPKLRKQVSDTLQKEFSSTPLAQSSFKGVQRPIEFIDERQLFYEGEWLNDQPHGKAIVYYVVGTYFEGYFNQGEVESKDCILVFPDGSYYRGEMKDSQFDGFGKFYSASGTHYSGEWKNGVPHGEGQQSFQDGNEYKGTFANGLKDGKGVFRWSDGKIYEGDFKNGKMHGQGKLSKKQEYYEGFFEENKKIGRNKLKTEFGVYNGEFLDGCIEGKGTFQWNDHTVYEGEFKGGLSHGEGSIKFAQGQTFTGVWEYGKNIKLRQIRSRSRSKPKSSMK